jgi:hypothetical protein
LYILILISIFVFLNSFPLSIYILPLKNNIYSIYSFWSTNTGKSHLHMQTLSKFELKWCINWKTPTFFQSKKPQISLFLNHEMSYTSNWRWEDEVSNLYNSWMDGESKAFTNHGENSNDLPSSEPRTWRTIEEWLGQREEEGYKRG